MKGPSMKLLEGVTIIESSAVITGPFAAMILADLGANVIKVEPPTGDQFRRWESDEAGVLPTFACYNRGKRSIAIDLKSEQGQEVYRRLVREADVVLENFRPGAMDRLGLGFESLRTINPRLVYCHISGMGTEGPERDRPTFDAVAQAMSGLWSQFTDLAAPEPVGPPMADQLTGMFAAIGILAGLQHRDRTGDGIRIETNMLAACLAFQGPGVVSYTYEGESLTKTARARQSQSYALVASDGKPLAIHLSTPKKFWAGLCRAAERPDLIEDARFDTKPKRIAAYDELHDLFSGVFSTRTRDEWLDRLQAEDVPCAPILTVGEAVEHPQVVHNAIIEGPRTEHEFGGLVRSPIRVGGRHLAGDRPAPRLGSDADSVLANFGFSEHERESLYADDVVRR